MLFFVAAALLSALLSDWTIEGSASMGLFGQIFNVPDQRSAVCTAAVVVGLVFLCILTRVLEKLSILRSDGDWIEEAARDISSRWSWSALGATYAVALVARYAMESARQIEQTGQIARGWDWLGGPLVIALVIHAVLCALACVGLFAFMRELDRTLDRVVAFVRTLITILDIYTHNVTRCTDRIRSVVYRRNCALARHLGERAPPHAHDLRSYF